MNNSVDNNNNNNIQKRYESAGYKSNFVYTGVSPVNLQGDKINLRKEPKKTEVKKEYDWMKKYRHLEENFDTESQASNALNESVLSTISTKMRENIYMKLEREKEEMRLKMKKEREQVVNLAKGVIIPPLDLSTTQ